MELITYHDYPRNRVDVYLREEKGNESVFTGFDGKHVVITRVNDLDANTDPVQPLLSMPPSMWRRMLPLFVDEATKNGIRTENENHLKGKLEATERHLNDLQKAFNKLLEK